MMPNIKEIDVRVILITILFLLLILLFTNEVSMAMSLKVAPVRVFFSLDEPKTQEVSVYNTTDEPIRVRVYPHMAKNQDQKYYLGDYLIISPTVISIKPEQKRTVRFMVNPPQELTNGEYRTLLFFEQLPSKREKKGTGDGEFKINMQLLTKLGINIYGQYGNIIHRGHLNNFKYIVKGDKLYLEGLFNNSGNAVLRMKASLALYDSEQKKVLEKEIPVFAVHRGSEKEFKSKLNIDKLKRSKYNLKMTFNLIEDKKVVEQINKEITVKSNE